MTSEKRFGGNQYRGAPRTCVASPPLCIANLVGNETSSSVTVPPTRQGACSDRAKPGSTPEPVQNFLALVSRRVREIGQKFLSWPRSTSTTATRTKFRGFQYSPWEYENQRRPGLSTRSHCREFLRERQKAPHRANFSLSTGVGLWLGDYPPGDQSPTLGTEGWLRPTVYFQGSKGDVSWRGYS